MAVVRMLTYLDSLFAEHDPTSAKNGNNYTAEKPVSTNTQARFPWFRPPTTLSRLRETFQAAVNWDAASNRRVLPNIRSDTGRVARLRPRTQNRLEECWPDLWDQYPNK